MLTDREDGTEDSGGWVSEQLCVCACGEGSEAVKPRYSTQRSASQHD